jgi:hypothetical protein
VKWIDGHLDLAWIATEGRDLRCNVDPAQGCVDLPALAAAGVDIVFGTIFTEPDDDAVTEGRRQLDVYRQRHQTMRGGGSSRGSVSSDSPGRWVRGTPAATPRTVR